MAVIEERAETAADLPDRLHLGCGEDIRSGAHNVDAIDLAGVDEVVDLNQYPWPWPDEAFRRIESRHVFEHLDSIKMALDECERILEPGGTLHVVLPMGVNADADGDHTWGENGRPWTWQRPEFECGKRHWDDDCGLEVVDKSVEMHSHMRGILGARKKAKWWYQMWRFGPGEWCFNLESMSGEFTAVFRKP